MSTYFNILQLVALYFPQKLILLGELIMSFNRLENFLLIDEVNMTRFSENTRSCEFKSQFKSQEPKEATSTDNYRLIHLEKWKLSDHPVYVKLQRVSANWINGQLTLTLSSQHSDTNSDYVENIPKAEMTAHSRIAGRVCKEYLHDDSNNFTLFVLLMIFSQVATTGSDYWLSYWTTLEDVKRIENTSDVKQFADIYNDSFLGLIFTLNPDGLLSTTDAIYRVNDFCIPERILNRFSKDMGIMDEWLSKLILEARGFK
ncbi:hypothetical protein G5I_11111 [Acromyrmex echinatior]|uniref:Uncharacterized protein n=1 Tax=Acromyrmex echinatior TaxID=103372 RepID=F4WYQ4_ACREC|nr:hypothetical protein G5I_11111 [Acromyrmex echinatior]